MELDKKKLQSAIELAEMVQFIMSNAENSASNKKVKQEYVDLSEKDFPFAGVRYSVAQIHNLLSELLTESSFSLSSEMNEVSGETQKNDFAKGRKENTLANRIRPVPEEVRGRVRELVDMLENEEVSDDTMESSRI